VGLRLGGSVTPRWAETYAFPEQNGVVVSEVAAGGPADRVGMMPRDLIVRVEGKAVSDAAQIMRMIRHARVGTTVRIEFVRLLQDKWERHDVRLRTVEAPGDIGPRVT